jgi:hypothetical protein
LCFFLHNKMGSITSKFVVPNQLKCIKDLFSEPVAIQRHENGHVLYRDNYRPIFLQSSEIMNGSNKKYILQERNHHSKLNQEKKDKDHKTKRYYTEYTITKLNWVHSHEENKTVELQTPSSDTVTFFFYRHEIRMFLIQKWLILECYIGEKNRTVIRIIDLDTIDLNDTSIDFAKQYTFKTTLNHICQLPFITYYITQDTEQLCRITDNEYCRQCPEQQPIIDKPSKKKYNIDSTVECEALLDSKTISDQPSTGHCILHSFNNDVMFLLKQDDNSMNTMHVLNSYGNLITFHFDKDQANSEMFPYILEDNEYKSNASAVCIQRPMDGPRKYLLLIWTTSICYILHQDMVSIISQPAPLIDKPWYFHFDNLIINSEYSTDAIFIRAKNIITL